MLELVFFLNFFNYYIMGVYKYTKLLLSTTLWAVLCLEKKQSSPAPLVTLHLVLRGCFRGWSRKEAKRHETC